MKALITALSMASTAVSYTRAEIISRAMKDRSPTDVWAVPTAVLAIESVISYRQHQRFDRDEFVTYEDAAELQRKTPTEEEGDVVHRSKDEARPKMETHS